MLYRPKGTNPLFSGTLAGREKNNGTGSVVPSVQSLSPVALPFCCCPFCIRYTTTATDVLHSGSRLYK